MYEAAPAGEQTQANHTRPEGALADIRVLDLTQGFGVYCTKLLADLGADVIKVEPPSGSAERQRGPFYHNEARADRSLWWLYLNTNKRGITLDIATNDGQALLKQLAAKATILVEDYLPGEMSGLGLGFADLHEVNSQLIVTSISPFGQSGPYAGYKASDLTAQAMCGFMYRIGYPEDPPNSISGGYTCFQTGAQGALATLVAILARDASGIGQQVDVSVHESMAIMDWDAMPRYALTGAILRRDTQRAEPQWTTVWHCKDGHVRFSIFNLSVPQPQWERLLGWLESHGLAGDLQSQEWQDSGFRQQNQDRIRQVMQKLLDMLPARQLMEEGQARHFNFAAYSTPSDLLTSPQLTEEGFFQFISHPEFNDTLVYAGAPYRLSGTPWRLAHTAPQLGEHNAMIYEGELGLSRREVIMLKEAGVI